MISKCSLDLALKQVVFVIMQNECALSNDALPGVYVMEEASSTRSFVFRNPP